MAQLSDDCFAFGDSLTPLDAALRALHDRTAAIADQAEVALAKANGRILAEDIVAPFNVPPHDNSAVDGYAVYFDDLDAQAETRLPVTGRAAAGRRPRQGPRGNACPPQDQLRPCHRERQRDRAPVRRVDVQGRRRDRRVLGHPCGPPRRDV